MEIIVQTNSDKPLPSERDDTIINMDALQEGIFSGLFDQKYGMHDHPDDEAIYSFAKIKWRMGIRIEKKDIGPFTF